MTYGRPFVRRFVCSTAVIAALAMVVSSMQAQDASGPTYNVLAALTTNDGELPIGKLAFDPAGNIFGVAAHGGDTTSVFCRDNSGCGTVFEVSPSSDGHWTINLIHVFSDAANDGALPLSGLILDASGNLYGVTTSGGSCSISPYGCGVVYEISPASGGHWQEPKILYSFQGTPDGVFPASALTYDKSGNLFGTTEDGGAANDGTVFELSPNASGEWTETILHAFNDSVDHDGYAPQGGVTFDPPETSTAQLHRARMKLEPAAHTVAVRFMNCRLRGPAGGPRQSYSVSTATTARNRWATLLPMHPVIYMESPWREGR